MLMLSIIALKYMNDKMLDRIYIFFTNTSLILIGTDGL